MKQNKLYNKFEYMDNNSVNFNTSNKKQKNSLNDDFFAAKNKKKLEEIEKLQNMSEIESTYSQNNSNINIPKPLYDLTIFELYQNCKKTWQDIIIEFDMSKIKSYEYLFLFFEIKNRKFYFGISLIIIGLILYIFDTLLIN